MKCSGVFSFFELTDGVFDGVKGPKFVPCEDVANTELCWGDIVSIFFSGIVANVFGENVVAGCHFRERAVVSLFKYTLSYKARVRHALGTWQARLRNLFKQRITQLPIFKWLIIAGVVTGRGNTVFAGPFTVVVVINGDSKKRRVACTKFTWIGGYCF